jgi:hypothetical protein
MDRLPEWEDLSEQFIAFFSRPQLKARLADDLIGMRMKTNESVQTYSARFMLEADGLDLKLSDNLLLCRVYRGGLLPAIREEFDRRLTFHETTSKQAFQADFEAYMETAISVELDLGRSSSKTSDKSSDPCKRPGHSGHKASECRLTKAEWVQSSSKAKSQQSSNPVGTAPGPTSAGQSAAPVKPAIDKTRLRCANEWCPNRHNHETVHCKSRPPIQPSAKPAVPVPNQATGRRAVIEKPLAPASAPAESDKIWGDNDLQAAVQYKPILLPISVNEIHDIFALYDPGAQLDQIDHDFCRFLGLQTTSMPPVVFYLLTPILLLSLNPSTQTGLPALCRSRTLMYLPRPLLLMPPLLVQLALDVFPSPTVFSTPSSSIRKGMLCRNTPH